jgi:L-threonylcarbamoyladenylate synthase
VIKTEILGVESSTAYSRAVQILTAGELIAFPTDTVYGLGAMLDKPEAIEKLFLVKGRDSAKAIAVLIGAVDALPLVAAKMNETARRLAERFWPGPLTLVVPGHPSLPANLSPLPTVGVRMPDHQAALELLRLTGPLAVTSANLSGAASTIDAQQVYEQLAGRVPLILDGGKTPGGTSSTVVDCNGQTLIILRQGPLSLEQLEAALL